MNIMESVVRKRNKENTKPVSGLKKQVISSTASKQRVLCKTAPLQSKNDLKEDNSGKKGKDVRAQNKSNDADPAKRYTLSQAFRTQQTIRQRKLVEEVQKPPSTVSAVQKSKPGTYKGRVIQSKIDCFRKPSGDVKTTEKKVISKPDETKAKPEVSKIRSKSVTSLQTSIKPRVNSALSSRSKSVSDVPRNVTEKPVHKSVSLKQIPQKVPSSISQTGAHRACVLPRPAPLATGRSATNKAFTMKKKVPVQVPKPKPPLTDQNVSRPVTSTVSQYKVQMETAEERRAKLAEWLASKGKSLKRPPISDNSAVLSRKPAPQPKPGPKATTCAQSKPVMQKTEPVKPAPALKTSNQTDKVPGTKPVNTSESSNIMNTTLDLLDNSDMDLPVDPEIRMESLVMNLCDKLEAMETPSSCEDAMNADECDAPADKRMEMQVEEHTTDRVFEILEEEELGDEEDITDDIKKADIKNEDDLEPQEKKLFDSEDDDGEEMRCTTPETEGASIVKYNVKTTPYLQSVKKRIECEEAPGSGSRRKSTIKDLKFLTPVRRSTRIQRKSSRLPGMLNDHDTCVSSLAELVQMEDADANAYIYRKNPALLEDLPNHPGDLAKVCS
ncbi:cytoskeleton-associated protein 2 isoform X1 [Danio rerio]|uniref:Cytoskeleton-associated protein 2 isoform X1 n=1 Tax=Danio rerio TaxID=7955 RepID=E7F392_DANRE|nr:cytoskeleton-associated protein 2 isoform X1 [Danio rerio]|eukprot:XP_697274.2 cytoskeleton-associated protein 2 isoform X1 [Danio rerio]